MRRNLYAPVCLLLTLYLGLWNGHLALRDTDTPAPMTVFPYSADLYPEADRRALEKGIPIESGQALVRLLEDYLS